MPRSLHAAGEWDRNGFDSNDLAALTRRDPELASALLRGERELRSGAVKAAVETFTDLVDRAPESALARRRQCQALTQAGDRRSAIAACEAAIGRRRSFPAFRALVGALMSAPPTPEELAIATALADAAARHLDDQPWGLAAKSEIAERTGDEIMLDQSVRELERIAPGHYETVRARRALQRFRLPASAWAAWLALGAALLGTLVHATWAALSSYRTKRAALQVTAWLLMIGSTLIGASRASAAPESTATATGGEARPSATPDSDGLSKWPVNEQNPVKSLPTPAQRDGNPMEFGYHMMDLADKADLAKAKGDFQSVAKYYEAIATAVPDRAIGYRKSCEAYDKVGNREKALQMCRGALGADGLEITDYLHFAKLVLDKQEPLTPVEVDDLTQIAAHLKAEPGGVAPALQVQCSLAKRLDDVQRLEACATELAKISPNDPQLFIYQWGIAMKKEDYRRAREIVASARKSAVLPPGIDVMERMTNEQSALTRRLSRAAARYAAPLAVGFALLLALGFGLWFRRRVGVHAL